MPTEQDYSRNKYQYSLEDYTTSGPEGDVQAVSYNPGYITDLLALQQKVMAGQGSDWDKEWYQQQAQAAMDVPMRDVSTLSYNAGDEAVDRLSGGSPDVGRIMMTLLDKMQQGTATDQERNLFKTTYTNLADQNWRASVPQESDANPFGMGNNLTDALGIIGLGATGGVAGGALAAGGGLASTLGSLGTLAGIGGTATGALGQEMDQEWLQKLGLGLGAAGGIAGGVGGLAHLWGSGINSLSDAASLASNAGRVVGGVGSVADSDVLKQAGTYLSAAGQGGAGAGTIADVFGGGVNNLTDLARLAQAAGQVTGAAGRATGNRQLQQASSLMNLGGNVRGLLGAANQAQQRSLTDEDWLRRGWRLRNPAAQSALYNL